uniref:Transposase n=1 Tax=Panagrolaimus sp. PS1159 TaxID=55785 RepID=A0AC35FFQ5_9BILA
MGRFFPKVVILDENDKNFKADLQYSKSIKAYYCNRCRKQKVTFTARIIDFEGNDAIEIGCSKHVCMNNI